MADTPRKKTLEELRSEAIGKLERRGYDVRGKTPGQIRQMLARDSRSFRLNRSSIQSVGKSIFGPDGVRFLEKPALLTGHKWRAPQPLSRWWYVSNGEIEDQSGKNRCTI